mgnify:CR=1 FL=1
MELARQPEKPGPTDIHDTHIIREVQRAAVWGGARAAGGADEHPHRPWRDHHVAVRQGTDASQRAHPRSAARVLRGEVGVAGMGRGKKEGRKVTEAGTGWRRGRLHEGR